MVYHTPLLAAHMQRRTHAFTLVELSIVIVIIGLIIGGIVGGQSLIESGRLNKVMATMQKYQAATLTFRDKHDNLPGDLPTALSYWPTTGVANGNGDGKILGATEPFTFWTHLSLAGMISGTYNGSTDYASAGYDNVVVTPYTTTWHSRIGTYFDLFTVASPWTWMTPEKMLNFDKKFDDGHAKRGKVFGVYDAVHCSDGALSTGYYNLTYTTRVCRPVVLLER